MLVIIEYHLKKLPNFMDELIERKYAEHLIKNAKVKEVVELAYQNWALDHAKGVVALDLIKGKLVGHSVESNTVEWTSNIHEVVIFELDANVDVEDVSILLGNSGVSALRAFLEIDDETFSENMTFWTEKYLRFHNLTIKHIRDSFIKVLYVDYKNAFFNSCIYKQLDAVYTLKSLQNHLEI